MKRYSDSKSRQAGVSYIEVLIAAVLLAAALAPGLDALSLAHMAPRANTLALEGVQRVASRMDEVLAEPFTALEAAAARAGSPDVPTDYSDPDGQADRLLVYLAPYDGDDADGNGQPFDGADAGLIWIRVAAGDSPYSLAMLVGQ